VPEAKSVDEAALSAALAVLLQTACAWVAARLLGRRLTLLALIGLGVSANLLATGVRIATGIAPIAALGAVDPVLWVTASSLGLLLAGRSFRRLPATRRTRARRRTPSDVG
jgi:hypothetical protein